MGALIDVKKFDSQDYPGSCGHYLDRRGNLRIWKQSATSTGQHKAGSISNNFCFTIGAVDFGYSDPNYIQCTPS